MRPRPNLTYNNTSPAVTASAAPTTPPQKSFVSREAEREFDGALTLASVGFGIVQKIRFRFFSSHNPSRRKAMGDFRFAAAFTRRFVGADIAKRRGADK